MNIKQLETFVWVVRLGSFSSAAERLSTTQSTISTRIHDLEQDLGISLFDRTHYRARLTSKGRELVPYAERIIEFVADVRHRIGDPKALTSIFRMGVAEMIAITWLPKLVVAIKDKYPNLRLEIDLNLANHLLSRLQQGDLDLILIPGLVKEGDFATESLGHVDLVWMADPALEIQEGRLGPKELRDWPIITLSKESNINQRIQAWFGDLFPDEFITVTHNNISVVAAMTMAGLGISVLPAVAYGKEIYSGRLRVLDTVPSIPSLELFAVRPKDRAEPLAEPIAALAMQVSEFLNG